MEIAQWCLYLTSLCLVPTGIVAGGTTRILVPPLAIGYYTPPPPRRIRTPARHSSSSPASIRLSIGAVTARVIMASVETVLVVFLRERPFKLLTLEVSHQEWVPVVTRYDVSPRGGSRIRLKLCLVLSHRPSPFDFAGFELDPTPGAARWHVHLGALLALTGFTDHHSTL